MFSLPQSVSEIRIIDTPILLVTAVATRRNLRFFAVGSKTNVAPSLRPCIIYKIAEMCNVLNTASNTRQATSQPSSIAIGEEEDS